MVELTLEQKLAAPLDARRVRERPNGRGGKLSYLETHDVIRTANGVFGFGKWGHEIVELRLIDSVVVHNSEQKAGVCVGYVCAVRLTVAGCVPVSGVGYGDATEYRESAPVTAHELAAKEAESDALKRALKNFGDQFGLALYDKAAASSGHVTSSAAPSPSRVTAETGGGAVDTAAQPSSNGGDEYRLTFGKHKGLPLSEVPRGYLEWVVSSSSNQAAVEACRAYLDRVTGQTAAPVGGGSYYEGASHDEDIPF